MPENQTRLTINAENIQLNDTFPTLKALFKAVANKPLSSGKTRENQLEQLSRHLEYRKLCEMDPLLQRGQQRFFRQFLMVYSRFCSILFAFWHS